MKIKDCFYFGKIGKPKGFKGEVNIIIDKSSPILPKKLNYVLILIGKKLINYPLSNYNITIKGNALGKFDGMKCDTDVNRIKNLSIYLPKEILPKLSEDKYYLHDLLGCTLIDKNFGVIGIISEVNSQTSQTLLFVETSKNEVIVPFVDEFIVNVNTSKKEVNLDLPEGILNLND